MLYFILFVLLPKPAILNVWLKHKPSRFSGTYSEWYYSLRSKRIIWHLTNVAEMSAFDNWHYEKLKEIDPGNMIFISRCDTRAEAKKQLHSHKNNVVPQMELE